MNTSIVQCGSTHLQQQTHIKSFNLYLQHKENVLNDRSLLDGRNVKNLVLDIFVISQRHHLNYCLLVLGATDATHGVEQYGTFVDVVEKALIMSNFSPQSVLINPQLRLNKNSNSNIFYISCRVMHDCNASLGLCKVLYGLSVI